MKLVTFFNKISFINFKKNKNHKKELSKQFMMFLILFLKH